ncbi:hypothetical protein [Methylobacterium sp. 77]|uniref:hypothetical protein n=1 Tax=Methylobacterium sp. 77 TaxID=1101192 RepID=UPI00036976E7|nr:hypothetical protein [Methylobacterium sp. 77]
MSDIVDQAAEAMRRMPPAERDSVAHAILTLAGRNPAGEDAAIDIEQEDLPFVLEGLAQIESGDVVEGDADALVAAAFKRHGPRTSM